MRTKSIPNLYPGAYVLKRPLTKIFKASTIQQANRKAYIAKKKQQLLNANWAKFQLANLVKKPYNFKEIRYRKASGIMRKRFMPKRFGR